MEKIFGVAGSALAAQLVRMNTTASNLANSSNTADTEEAAYKAKRVVFRTLLNDETIGDQTRFAGSIHIQWLSTCLNRFGMRLKVFPPSVLT